MTSVPRCCWNSSEYVDHPRALCAECSRPLAVVFHRLSISLTGSRFMRQRGPSTVGQFLGPALQVLGIFACVYPLVRYYFPEGARSYRRAMRFRQTIIPRPGSLDPFTLTRTRNGTTASAATPAPSSPPPQRRAHERRRKPANWILVAIRPESTTHPDLTAQ